MIEVIFGVAEYDQPKVYEAGFIPRSLLHNENEFSALIPRACCGGASLRVIFGVAEYDQPKVYEAGFIPRSLLHNENEFYRLDTPCLLRGASLRSFSA